MARMRVWWKRGTLVAALGLAAAGVTACGPDAPPPPPPAHLVASQTSVVFSPTGGSGSVNAIVFITNDGGTVTPIMVVPYVAALPAITPNVTTDCSAFPTPGHLAPGGRCQVTLSIPGGTHGLVGGTLKVGTPTDVVLTISISGSI